MDVGSSQISMNVLYLMMTHCLLAATPTPSATTPWVLMTASAPQDMKETALSVKVRSHCSLPDTGSVNIIHAKILHCSSLDLT